MKFMSCVERVNGNNWEREAKAWLADLLTPNFNKPGFPCIPAISAFRSGEMPMYFVSRGMNLQEQTAKLIAGIVDFYDMLPVISPRNAALLAFFEEGVNCYPREYRDFFWKILSELRKVDPVAWPADKIKDIYDPKFEYCLLGKPIFATGFWQGHPHVSRRTQSPVGMLIVFGLPVNVEHLKDDADRAGGEGRFHQMVESIRARDDIYSRESGGRLEVSQYSSAPVHSQIYEYQGMKTEETVVVPLNVY